MLGVNAHPSLLMHGAPYPWNVLNAVEGPLFIGFENCARGAVEYDLAWVPTEVNDRYPAVDRELFDECRGFVLALVAAHRWRRDDQHPSGRPSGVAFLDVLRLATLRHLGRSGWSVAEVPIGDAHIVRPSPSSTAKQFGTYDRSDPTDPTEARPARYRRSETPIHRAEEPAVLRGPSDR